MMKCTKCGRETEEFFNTLYGECLCDHCYDDYLMTDEGKVEYMFGITTGREELKDYDSDFLGHVAACWKKYSGQLDLSDTEVLLIEAKASALGLL